MAHNVRREEDFLHVLPHYYKRLFPLELVHKWLCYGSPQDFYRREISFTLVGDIYLRYQSFSSAEKFADALQKKVPVKIDIGAVYNKPLLSLYKSPVERELVFDIDISDYDEVRYCCSGAAMCSKCWKLMVIACKIIDASLRLDFGFANILWVFSGRRGIHCWVADKDVRDHNDSERSAIAESLQVIIGGFNTTNANLPCNIPFCIKRSLKIIDEYFDNTVLVGQDILGNDERLEKFLNYIRPKEFKSTFKEEMEKFQDTQDRWNAFENTFKNLLENEKVPPDIHLVEEIKLIYAYPRLDINVTKSISHLLKAPFCVHPKTGKVAVPFKAQFVDRFDPDAVPTIRQLFDEVDAYDAKTQELEKSFSGMSTENVVTPKIKDYKKTSLLKYTTVFNEFLRGLRASAGP